MTTRRNMNVQLTALIPEQDVRRVQAMAAGHDVTDTEAFLLALVMGVRLLIEHDKGAKVLYRLSDGSYRELMPWGDER